MEYDTQLVAEGGFAVEPSAPEKVGFTFLGWANTNGEIVDVTSIEVTTSVTYTAKFEQIFHTITFIVDGKKYDTQSVAEGGFAVEPSEPEKAGFTFLGWSTSQNGNTIDVESTEIHSDINFYAVFEEIKKYDVIFYVNGEVYKKQIVLEGEGVTPVSDPKLSDGEIFVGWAQSMGATADEIIDVTSVVVDKNTYFYAVVEVKLNDPELVEKLNRGYKQLAKIKASGLAKSAITEIRNCISKVLDDANAGKYISKKYVVTTYAAEVGAVKKIVKEDMTATERSNFVNLVTNPDRIDQDVQDFLVEYFDINVAI